MSAEHSPGVELLLELVRDAARGRRCTTCGNDLASARIDADDVDLERVVARIHCRCGNVESIEVRPAEEGGSAEIR